MIELPTRGDNESYLSIVNDSSKFDAISMSALPLGARDEDRRYVLSPVPRFYVLEERYWSALARHLIDAFGSVLLLIFTTPFWFVAAVLIKLTSPGPVFFKQTRLGRGGVPFTCYKFRSMVHDADMHKPTLLHLNEVGGPVFKMRQDPRTTTVGRWLRKMSIDELPQLINVLRGEMSLVGPRPSLPSEVEGYLPEYRLRLSVRPGITGLWQVSGRSHLSFEQWMALDLEYLERRSIRVDLVLMLRTIPAVLLQRGAC